MRNEVFLTVIIPVFNEEESLPHLCRQLYPVLDSLENNFEVIFVDDGSTDRSFSVLKTLSTKYLGLRAIRFRRNCRKASALSIGFKEARGALIVTMDADLQDDPQEIPQLIDALSDNLDLVSGWKKKRYDPITKTIPTKLFNWAARRASGIYLNDFNCGLKAYKGQVVRSIEVYGEMHRYIPVIAKRSGFTKIGEKAVKHYPRKYGVTKFGLERFINGFLDLLSISFVTKYSKKPMHFFGFLGSSHLFTFWVTISDFGPIAGEFFHDIVLIAG